MLGLRAARAAALRGYALAPAQPGLLDRRAQRRQRPRPTTPRAQAPADGGAGALGPGDSFVSKPPPIEPPEGQGAAATAAPSWWTPLQAS